MFNTNKEAGDSGMHGKVKPTHIQIEERARSIWQKKGCPSGQDEKNWFEAESQLKKELSTAK